MFHVQRKAWLHRFAVLALACVMTLGLSGGNGRAATNIPDNGGPTMLNQVKVFLIFWQPSGVVFDSSVANGVGNYETLPERFLGDVSGTSYLNILTQYPGSCGSNQCVLRNQAGAIGFGGSWVDTGAYPHAGTQADPLQDSDIQAEVQRAATQNHWAVNGNALFFVVTGVIKNTGVKVEECTPFGNCTFGGPGSFCAYHSTFSQGGNSVVYGYLSSVGGGNGCLEGIGTPANGQVASDRLVALMTHEFAEAVSDPHLDAWIDESNGAEIGDNCNQLPVTVALNANTYDVQQLWSNASSNCVSSLGLSIKFAIQTGGDDLRGDSSASAALQKPGGASFQTVSLKAQREAGWAENSTHIVVAGFNQATQTALAQIAVTLGQHGSFPETQDNWNVQTFDIQVLNATGGVLCEQKLEGNPLARLTGSVPTVVFDTSSCLPPPVLAFNQVTYTIVTGGDDLRGDSSATTNLGVAGKSLPFTLKAQSDPGWGENSTHTKAFAVSPAQPLTAFSNLSVTLTSHDSWTETQDNWNIESINVKLTGPGGQACLVNLSGDPFARLTGSGPTVKVAARAGC
jgi:hypothetical protein